jgi:hypothetical protein
MWFTKRFEVEWAGGQIVAESAAIEAPPSGEIFVNITGQLRRRNEPVDR